MELPFAKSSTDAITPSVSLAEAVIVRSSATFITASLAGLMIATVGGRVKLPVIILLVFITSVRGFWALLVSPLHPTNTLPGSGVAVAVTDWALV